MASPIQVSKTTSVLLSERLGAFIIVAGDRPDNNSQNNIVNGSDQAYHDLVTYCAFSPSRVYYLGPVMNASHPHVNAVSTLPNIKHAILNWSANKVDADHGLGLYLYDHGGYDVMCIPGGENLNDTTLNSWLNTLFNKTGCSRDIIIYEACQSGSFVHVLSGPDRIIVASTDALSPGYFSKRWAFFSESFWGSISTGGTIGDAFIAATKHVAWCGYEYPQVIDDNGDGIYHWADFYNNGTQTDWSFFYFLPNGGDGIVSKSTFIRGDGTPAPGPVLKVDSMNPHIWLDNNTTTQIPIWAVVANPANLTHLWARLTPPGWVPPNPPPPVNGIPTMAPDTNATYIEMQSLNGGNNYTGSFTVGSVLAPHPVLGDYHVTVIPEGDAGIGSGAPETVTINTNGLAPLDHTPPIVEIMSPGNNTSINGTINVLAYGNDDQKLASVHLFIDDQPVAALDTPTYPYPTLNFTWDTTSAFNGAHVIKAIATDAAGLNTTTTINVNVTNPSKFMAGYDIIMIVGASVTGLVVICSKQRIIRRTR